MVGPNDTALVDTYCNVAKGNDLRLEVFGQGLGATTIAGDQDVIIIILGVTAPSTTASGKQLYVEFYEKQTDA